MLQSNSVDMDVISFSHNRINGKMMRREKKLFT